jgi:hypothetical protein
MVHGGEGGDSIYPDFCKSLILKQPATLGPDGNLYIGWARNGTIARIPHPDTFNLTIRLIRQH